MVPLKGDPCDEETNTNTCTTQRYLSLPRLASFLIFFGLGGYWISTKLGDWSNSELEEEHSEHMTKRIQELEKARKEEEDFQRDFRRSLTPNDSTELTMGSFRYKLFKKPKLHSKRANKYCRKMDGRLAIIQKAENTRKLQQLIGDREVKGGMDEYYGRGRDAVWVGQEKKKKKKKPAEEEEGGEPNYMDYMDHGMMGGRGRGEEMCPAISPNSVYVPSPCQTRLPFICQFDKNSPRKDPPSDEEFGGGRGSRYASEMGRMDDEM